MTQIEQKTANAAAKRETDGGNLSTEIPTQYVPSSIGKLAGVNPQTILDRVAQGELLREIAAEYDCSAPAVTLFIKRHVNPETWATVREQSIASRLERSTESMEAAEDQLSLARARESARLWMWRAEREMPHIWGQRPTTAINVGGDGMQVQIVSYAVAPTTHVAVLTPPEVVDAQVVPEQVADSNDLVQSSDD